MTKTQSRSKSSTHKQVQPQEPHDKLKIGDPTTIDSTHPIFPGEECTITDFPSPNAAIVELEDGKREYVQLKYLQYCVPNMEQTIELNTDLKSPSNIEIANAPSEFSPPKSDSHTTIEVIQELTPDEERERHRLELKVGRAFYEAGAALRELRDKRLYRSTHKTFQEYCTQRFGMTRRKGDYLISAAGIFENLEMRTNRSQILPTNMEQVRPLMSLPQADDQWTAWSNAVKTNDGQLPTGKLVKGIVERMKEKPSFLASDYCSVGEIFRLQRLKDDDQKYNGWWGIALEVENRLSVKCQVYDRTIEIRLENIKRIDMDKQQLVHQQEIISRVSRLARCNLDPAVWALLEVLNQQTYHTNVQMKLLETAEQLYGIYDHKN